MADVKISALPAASAVDSDDLIPVVEDGTTVKATTTQVVAAGGLTAHEADTTSIHGITDTSVLATATWVATAVSNHEADTTSVHGITDTSTLYRSGGTDVAIADGGTGASTVAAARSNLVVIGGHTGPTGVLAESCPRAVAGGSSPLTSGTLRLVAITLPIDLLVTNVTFCSATTAAVAPTNWWFMIADSSRITLRKTADQTSTAWAANTIKTVALASTLTTTYSGVYYLGVVMAAGTAISMAVVTGNTGTAAMAPIQAGNTSNTGLTTPVDFNPAGAITSSSNTVWAMVT